MAENTDARQIRAVLDEFTNALRKKDAKAAVAAAPQAPLTNPSSAHDARRAFEDLFKK